MYNFRILCIMVLTIELGLIVFIIFRFLKNIAQIRVEDCKGKFRQKLPPYVIPFLLEGKITRNALSVALFLEWLVINKYLKVIPNKNFRPKYTSIPYYFSPTDKMYQELPKLYKLFKNYSLLKNKVVVTLSWAKWPYTSFGPRIRGVNRKIYDFWRTQIPDFVERDAYKLLFNKRKSFLSYNELLPILGKFFILLFPFLPLGIFAGNNFIDRILVVIFIAISIFGFSRGFGNTLRQVILAKRMRVSLHTKSFVLKFLIFDLFVGVVSSLALILVGIGVLSGFKNYILLALLIFLFVILMGVYETFGGVYTKNGQDYLKELFSCMYLWFNKKDTIKELSDYSLVLSITAPISWLYNLNLKNINNKKLAKSLQEIYDLYSADHTNPNNRFNIYEMLNALYDGRVNTLDMLKLTMVLHNSIIMFYITPINPLGY